MNIAIETTQYDVKFEKQEKINNSNKNVRLPGLPPEASAWQAAVPGHDDQRQ